VVADAGPARAQADQHLIEDIARNGNEGIGKPEALKHDFAGYWSRRITDEHRLVYQLVDDEIRIAACRYHYGR
jgi:toxin YoeB